MTQGAHIDLGIPQPAADTQFSYKNYCSVKRSFYRLPGSSCEGMGSPSCSLTHHTFAVPHTRTSETTPGKRQPTKVYQFPQMRKDTLHVCKYYQNYPLDFLA